MSVFLCAYVDTKSELLIRVNGKVQGQNFEKLELAYPKFWAKCGRKVTKTN